MDEEEVGGDLEEGGGGEGKEETAASAAVGSRKEKRKEKKKTKRKQMRRQAAVREREEEERRMNDPEEQRRAREAEEAEREAVERARKEFEEAERVWLEEMEKKRKEEEEEEERRKAVEGEEEKRRLQVEMGNQCDKDDDWEYAEEGPAEIIWQGNEIIVRKKKVRVPKKNGNQQNKEEDANRPTSNPLPPQSEVFSEHQNASSAQQILEHVAQQVPNFGTEQDKAHCPFHLKTGACRFGQRCSRVHFYPDKACTILIKNMYNGPGIAWEQDEGLEYTDEEVDRCYEEFYEDVHTEFLKYGELVNFKVCKNGSFHLRGNVYVHYKSLDSAVLAYLSINGRYFAGKQVKCEFVNVTKWKIAICGEFMKSRLKTCSHGTACNFIHCFRNPGGDYEWADWDKPPPRYWVKKMVALFGYSAESEYEKQMEQEKSKSISKRRTIDTERHHARPKSQETDQLIHRPSRSNVAEDDVQKTTRHRRYTNNSRKQSRVPDDKSCEENSRSKDRHRGESRRYESESDEGWLRRDVHAGRERHRHHGHPRKRSKYSSKVSEDSTDFGENRSGTSLSDSAEWSDGGRKGQARRNHNLSNSAEGASLDDGVRADGNNLDRDRERKTLSSRLDRSSSHRSEASKTIDADTGPDDSGKGRHKHRRHGKKCSGNQESNKCVNDQFNDRNRRHGSDSSDDRSDRDKEKYHCRKSKRSKGSPEISNEGGATRKRLKEKSNSDRAEIEKSQHIRKSDDSDSSIEETVGQDRWEVKSPGRWGDIGSERLYSDEDYHNNEKMDRVGLGKSTSWDRNSADSKSRVCNDRRNNNCPRRDEIVTASPKEAKEVDDENNKYRHSKHRSRSYK